jgi:hypothetical protein
MFFYPLELYEYISLVVYYFAFLMRQQDIFMGEEEEQEFSKGRQPGNLFTDLHLNRLILFY